MSKKLEITLEKLFIEGLDGNKKSYAEFLKLFSSFLEKKLLSKISNQSDIDDLIQEILISIHKARHTYDIERRLKPWLISIINFRVSDYFRKFYRDRKDQQSPFDENFDIADENSVTESVTDNEDIINIVDTLKDKQREIIKLMYFKDLSVKEIAAQTGYSQSDVKVTAHRAYKILRTKFVKNKINE